MNSKHVIAICGVLAIAALVLLSLGQTKPSGAAKGTKGTVAASGDLSGTGNGTGTDSLKLAPGTAGGGPATDGGAAGGK